jgi:hypothetical protein
MTCAQDQSLPQGVNIMSFISSRPVIGILVVLVTIIVCSVGIRAELRESKQSVVQHRLRSNPIEPVAPASVDVNTP